MVNSIAYFSENLISGIAKVKNDFFKLSKIKNIYVNADGSAWIRAGMKRLGGVTYVLDEFHLNK